MTYPEFIQLDKLMQVAITLEEGVVVSKRIEHDDVLLLYQLHNFYVELAYLEDLSEIYAIRHSDHDVLLEPYLQTIDIAALIQVG